VLLSLDCRRLPTRAFGRVDARAAPSADGAAVGVGSAPAPLFPPLISDIG